MVSRMDKSLNFVPGCISATFLDSVLGVPSTLLFIFWAGFIFSIPNSEFGGIPVCLGKKKKSLVKQVGVTSEKGSGALLTRGVVGHICAHRVRSWAPLVHHSVHAVHARAVRGACSHHALGHVRVARWPKEKGACLILAEVLQLHQADLSNRPKGSGRVILILSSPCSAAALTILLCLFCIKRSIYVIIQQFQPTSASL